MGMINNATNKSHTQGTNTIQSITKIQATKRGEVMPTVKIYNCKTCKKTMMIEVFADEKTTLEIMKHNPYCNDCKTKEVK